MPAICDLEGCWEVGDFFLKGYPLCPEHGDAVIDKLQESGVSVHEATVAHPRCAEYASPSRTLTPQGYELGGSPPWPSLPRCNCQHQDGA